MIKKIMLQVLDSSHGNLLALRATGKLHSSDYNYLIPLFEEKIRQYKKIRCYLELYNFEGWTGSSFIKEITFDLKHTSHFEMVAIVGDKNWEKWMADISSLFTPAKVRFFKLDDRQAAMAWLHPVL